MTIQQISVFVPNVPGWLADITETLAKNEIDIRALSIADTTDFGILRIIVDKPAETLAVLRGNDMIVTVTDVLAVHIDDQPGGLSFILRLLADANISIEYLYAFVTRKENNAYVVFRLEDNAAANDIFEKNGVKLAAPEDIYEM